MAEAVADHFGVCSGGDEQGRAGMPQIVETEAMLGLGQRLLDRGLEMPAIEQALADWGTFPRREHEVVRAVAAGSRSG
jgi:hypothetical protein